MSAAATPAAGTAPAKKGSKKLIIIIAAVLLLVLGGGGAAFFMMKKKAADAEAEADGEDGGTKAAAHAPAPKPHATHEAGHPPNYVALDPFIVNLADRETERYAQIGMTLEVDDAKFAEQMKGYMPAIRNAILMILAHKTSVELLQREGKEKLAEEVMRESVRPMGIEIDPEEPEDPAATGKKKKKHAPVYNPVTQVHYSSFIIQ
ncbi:MAG: flagellar basal body-associated protein FliL [Leptothrix sp. (in: b-proteobacteria)]